MSSVSEYFSGLFKGISSLVTGMRVTWKELFSKKVTQQYPENRSTLVISDRFLGELVMPHDENNEHACTSCLICQTNCPNGTIRITSKVIETEDGKKKKILDQYYYNLGTCTFCNLCVLTCPSDAIKFSNNFENALFTRAKLDHKLNKEGSKMREKKVAPKPKPEAPKATEEKPVVEKQTSVEQSASPEVKTSEPIVKDNPSLQAPSDTNIPVNNTDTNKDNDNTPSASEVKPDKE